VTDQSGERKSLACPVCASGALGIAGLLDSADVPYRCKSCEFTFTVTREVLASAGVPAPPLRRPVKSRPAAPGQRQANVQLSPGRAVRIITTGRNT
jgi:hypothetical protein